MAKKSRHDIRPRHPLIDALRKRRLVLKLTQETVSEWAGHHKAAVSDWENGENTPSFLALADWGSALGFKLGWQP